ncbi:MAG TPA: hypothetical protein VFN30_02065 [Chitinophagaceae bacterium]|nr:hypothetical protein [Chitinophagaceae bacterium]
MKRILIYTSLLFAMGIGLIGCYKDVILPEALVDPDGPPQAVAFKAELVPLFASKCALPGCHVSGAHQPYLSSDLAYLQLVNNGWINTLIPKESKIYVAINGIMKEYIPAATDRQKVYDWIRNGAPNN